jgi:hypothetical protein
MQLRNRLVAAPVAPKKKPVEPRSTSELRLRFAAGPPSFREEDFPTTDEGALLAAVKHVKAFRSG